jgi:hypothetical protein
MVDLNEIEVHGCNFVMFNTNGDIHQHYTPHPLLGPPFTTTLHFVNSLFPIKIAPHVVNLKKSNKKDNCLK